MIMEGASEIILALFFADLIKTVFGKFSLSITGAMLLFASLELGKFIVKTKENIELILIATIGIVSFFTNLAVGFFLGVLLYYAIKRLSIHQ